MHTKGLAYNVLEATKKTQLASVIISKAQPTATAWHNLAQLQAETWPWTCVQEVVPLAGVAAPELIT